jgi:hypothetical protein
MIIFRYRKKDYHGAFALEVVRKLESDTPEYPYGGQAIRRFLLWSLHRLDDKIPPREIDLSDCLKDEDLALSYLHLRDEYGAGTLLRLQA